MINRQPYFVLRLEYYSYSKQYEIQLKELPVEKETELTVVFYNKFDNDMAKLTSFKHRFYKSEMNKNKDGILEVAYGTTSTYVVFQGHSSIVTAYEKIRTHLDKLIESARNSLDIYHNLSDTLEKFRASRCDEEGNIDG